MLGSIPENCSKFRQPTGCRFRALIMKKLKLGAKLHFRAVAVSRHYAVDYHYQNVIGNFHATDLGL